MTREELLNVALLQATEEGVGIHLAKFADICIEWATNEAVEKACEWLKSNLCEHYADKPFAHKFDRPISGYISFFEEPPVGVIANFRKAMGSSCSEKPNNCEKGGEK